MNTTWVVGLLLAACSSNRRPIGEVALGVASSSSAFSCDPNPAPTAPFGSPVPGLVPPQMGDRDSAIQPWLTYVQRYGSWARRVAVTLFRPAPEVDLCGWASFELPLGRIELDYLSHHKNVWSPFGYGFSLAADNRAIVSHPGHVSGQLSVVLSDNGERTESMSVTRPGYPDRLYSNWGTGKYVKRSELNAEDLCEFDVRHDDGSRWRYACHRNWARARAGYGSIPQAYFLHWVEDGTGARVTYSWDDFDRLTSIEYPDGYTLDIDYPATTNVRNSWASSVTESFGPHRRTWQLGYTNGYLTSVALPSGRTHAFEYDEWGRVARIRYADGRNVGFEYNPLDQVVTYLPGDELDGDPVELAFSYVGSSSDDFRVSIKTSLTPHRTETIQLRSEGMTPGVGWGVTHTGIDNRTRRATVNHRGVVVDYADPFGRTVFSLAEGEFRSWVHSAGRIHPVLPPESMRTVPSSDRTTFTTTRSDGVKVIESLDDAGRPDVREIVTVSGRTASRIDHDYDPMGRLRSVVAVDLHDDGSSVSRTWTHTYGPKPWLLASTTDPFGRTCTYTYGLLDRLQSVTCPGYEWSADVNSDPNGLASETIRPAGTAGVTWQRQFWPNGQIKQSTNPAGVVTEWDQDTLGRPSGGSTGTFSWEVALDSAGRATRTSSGLASPMTRQFDHAFDPWVPAPLPPPPPYPPDLCDPTGASPSWCDGKLQARSCQPVALPLRPGEIGPRRIRWEGVVTDVCTGTCDNPGGGTCSECAMSTLKSRQRYGLPTVDQPVSFCQSVLRCGNGTKIRFPHPGIGRTERTETEWEGICEASQPHCSRMGWPCFEMADASGLHCSDAMCGNSYCEYPETDCTCPLDCPDYDNSCGVRCGNAICDARETCESCPTDCGSCCGNGVCESGRRETCYTCPSDCGACTCGNGYCEPGEQCDVCAPDCGSCPENCGDGVCAYDEACGSCPSDCGPCGIGPDCGDGFCDPFTETCSTCAFDCGSCYCGNGTCETSESCGSCPSDCSCDSCGNGTCEGDETCGGCPGDCLCVACGDGTCDASESCSSCHWDCGACPVCGDGVCAATETCTGCPLDCGACADCGDGVCVGAETCSNCPADCGTCVGCGDGVCGAAEDCFSCTWDCGSCSTCGDGICDSIWGESNATCWQDCLWESGTYGTGGNPSPP